MLCGTYNRHNCKDSNDNQEPTETLSQTTRIDKAKQRKEIQELMMNEQR